MYVPMNLVLLFVIGGALLIYIINAIHTGKIHRSSLPTGAGFVSVYKKKNPGVFWLVLTSWVVGLLIAVAVVLTGIV